MPDWLTMMVDRIVGKGDRRGDGIAVDRDQLAVGVLVEGAGARIERLAIGARSPGTSRGLGAQGRADCPCW